MCELLVRVRDKPLTGGVTVDAGRGRRGDVVVACPDGWAWSRIERTHPRWIIIRVPGMTLAEGQSFATPEPSGQPKKRRGRQRRVFWKRLFTLDMDTLVGTYDGRRQAESVTVPLENVRASRSTKPPIEIR